MIAEKLISDFILPLKTSDTGLRALAIMDEYRVSHLPIVNNEQFLGLISDNDIFDFNAPEEALGNHPLTLTLPYVTTAQHIFDVIKVITSDHLSLIPVLDENKNYVGVITLNDLVKEIALFTAIHDPGAILVLEMNIHDYSLSQISQIVESNDARVLSAYVTSYFDSTKLEVTIKINKTEIDTIIKTFTRYNYMIKASYNKSDDMDDLRERFDSLMNYLNM